DRIVRSETHLQRSGELPETLVAGTVAVRVVDLLESVEIEKQKHRADRLHRAQNGRQRAAIRKARQRIAVRERTQFFLRREQIAIRLRELRLNALRDREHASECEEPLRTAVE